MYRTVVKSIMTYSAKVWVIYKKKKREKYLQPKWNTVEDAAD